MSGDLTLCYVGNPSMGYGRLGVELARGLADVGITVWNDNATPTIRASARRRHEHSGRTAPPDGQRTGAVCWVSVPSHAEGWWAGQHPMVFTMWEASFLPEAFRETLHEFDRIIVPSLHNVELFSRYHADVQYVPLGVDPEAWHYTPRPEVREQFRFLIGGSGARKGTDLAYDAFKAVFGKQFRDGQWIGRGPEPRLVMKNPKSEPFPAPWVEMVGGRLTADEEIALYETAHVYLQPSRGEGFGLQPLQAIAQGLPTILTNAHGHASFAPLGIPIGYSMQPSNYFIYGEAGDWWEPDFDELCEAMFATYTDYEPYRIQAGFAAREVAENWTWAHTTDRFIDAVGYDLINQPMFQSGDWVEIERALYHVRVKKTWAADIAGQSYRWDPGIDYYEPADIKRILFEGGLLDPACVADYHIDADTGAIDAGGLLPSQIDRSKNPTGAHAYCPTCHTQLNTGIQRADVIEAELAAQA